MESRDCACDGLGSPLRNAHRASPPRAQVGDAYIVVGGLNRSAAAADLVATGLATMGTSSGAPRSTQSNLSSRTRSHLLTSRELGSDAHGQSIDERRTRALLERVFALAHAMQVRRGEGGAARVEATHPHIPSLTLPLPPPQDALQDLRSELDIPLHARMGVHCGDVVSGLVGSQRPRFCERVRGTGAAAHRPPAPAASSRSPPLQACSALR